MEEQSPNLVPLPVVPRVSVLIVLRPGSPSIEPLLEALQQTPNRETVEVAVLDNGAQLVTGALEDQFPQVSFRKLPRFFGYTKAANILARNAAGDHVLLWDPALQATPETLDCLLNALASRPDAGAVCPLILNEQGQPDLPVHQLPDAPALSNAWRSNGRFPAGSSQAEGEPFSIECLSTPAILVRREFLRGMNFFDDRYGEFGPLLELCFQLRQAGKKILAVPSCQVTRTGAEAQFSAAGTAQLAADFALGASRYLTRRQGFGAGLGFRVKAALGALGRAVTFQSPGQSARQAWLIASGQKIDGTQGNFR